MTGIQVTFDADPGYVGMVEIPIDVVNDRFETTWQGTTPLTGGITIPVTQPGVYLVRATLPSGEVMSSTVRAAQDQTVMAMLRPPKRSPNEGLAWAYYMQRVPAQSGWHEENIRRRGPAFDDLAFATPSLPTTELWLCERDNRWRRAHTADATTSPVGINPGDVTALVATDVVRQGVSGTVWGAVEWEGDRKLVAIPVANQQSIRVFVVRDDHDVEKFRVLIGGSHPEAEAILGFLTSGDFEAARRVGEKWFDKAEQLLRDRTFDPIAATLAGYFLLRAGGVSRLHDWTSNLANWFDWLPDGAVICGWHMALTNRWSDAEHWLTEAVHRGIPLYTQGLRLLHDGLRILDGRGAEVREPFDRIRAVAARAKWSSGVTCLLQTDPRELVSPPVVAPAGGGRR
jgi:hypothetical protein